jgi:hypothetical protein
MMGCDAFPTQLSVYQTQYSFTSWSDPDVLDRLMAVTKTELRKVITKLDDVKIELLRLRAALLPEERLTPKERKLIEQGRLEIEKGRYFTLGQLRKELGA